MKRIVYILLTALLLAGCKTQKSVSIEYRHDTAYMTQYKVDSVDRWHTHYEYVKGDTISIIDSIYIYRYLRTTDTAYKYKTITKTDTKEVVKVENVYVWKPFFVVFMLFLLVVLFRKKIFNLLKKTDTRKLKILLRIKRLQV